MKKRYFCIAVVAVAAAILVVFEIFGLDGLGIEMSKTANDLVSMTVTRGIGGIVFLVLLWYLEYNVLNPVRKPFWKCLLFCLPAFAVVINNLHIYTLITGREKVVAGASMIALLALECFCIGLFEEMAFRGVVFLGILERRRKSVKDIVLAILLSSAVFGIIHSVNFLYSAPGAVIQQIGYSFLIGAMCSVVLVKTKNIWICVVLHAIFNFGGALVPTLGQGFVWDAPTIVITVLIAVATTVYMTVALIRMPVCELDEIYSKNNEKN
ncbi:MAG: CPBP family intramembrane metalloprotease [Ruminococcaceae bacterium]|nr:CPBP family intramembrane metalloprotease [Oscillospiraceae bacterium]